MRRAPSPPLGKRVRGISVVDDAELRTSRNILHNNGIRHSTSSYELFAVGPMVNMFFTFIFFLMCQTIEKSDYMPHPHTHKVQIECPSVLSSTSHDVNLNRIDCFNAFKLKTKVKQSTIVVLGIKRKYPSM